MPSLSGSPGANWWRRLDELAEEPSFRRRVERQFPDLASSSGGLDRRRLLQLMAASMALGGLAGCGRSEPANEAIPYVDNPPGSTPGETRSFASAITRDGYANGVIVTHRMARPINLAGNPDHPASLGGIDPVTQAAILGLYDPDRSSAVLNRGTISTAAAVIAALAERLARLRQRRGEGLRLLTGRVTSPTLAAQMAALQRDLPGLRWHCWDSGFRDPVRAGAALAFGRPVDTVFNLAVADVIVAVESDLLDSAPGHLAYARAFGRRRRDAARGNPPLRLYAIESTPTLTGANADHRLVLAPARVESALRALLARVGSPLAAPAGEEAWVADVAADLVAAKGRALVHVGPEQPPVLHALGHAINEALAAPGQTLSYIEPVEANPQDQLRSLSELAEDMRAGRVDTLAVLGSNPVFTAPADFGFAEAMSRVGMSVHLGTEVDETAAHADWHLPEAHELESWRDARAFDGTVTILQPQLRPLYGGWSPHELLALLAGDVQPSGYAILRSTWQQTATQRGIADFEAFWVAAVRSGVVPDTKAVPVAVSLAGPPPPAPAPLAAGLVALFRPDPWLRDGRYANNGWLQELPRPLTKLTWDNAVLIAPATAAARGLADGAIVELATAGGRVKAPVLILPGQAPDCVTLPLGFGRRTVGRVGLGAGFDAFALRSSTALWENPVALTAESAEYALARTDGHDRMEGRDIVRVGTLAEFRADPGHTAPAEHPSLYPEYRYDGYAWGMAIDLGACIGCGACTAACQAENNIPIVGRDEVRRARELHWIRVDRYYRGPADAPEFVFQPVPCMHCEHAPCEVVCPVEATMHDADGLNVMVYNRCVGTRFCSNNCPYKVRRFNFFDYAEADPRLDLAWNPDLSVRARGVMEKCTYCIQRIRGARIEADREDRAIRDGEVVTACQAACPTEAIVFGDLNDPQSAVRRRKATPLDYALLGELDTRPRTTYQKRLLNPNPALARDQG
ncbi:MAG: Fe-S-cluster-containing hydrogenase [Alphaproteobacteria bacterium]|nr:Fe-S-cluster-containing hydrogenase [Alphaproteobacteria bacterium]